MIGRFEPKAVVISFIFAIVFCNIDSSYGIGDIDFDARISTYSVTPEASFYMKTRFDLFSLHRNEGVYQGTMSYLSFSSRFDFSTLFFVAPIGINFGAGNHLLSQPAGLVEFTYYPKTNNFRDWVHELGISFKFLFFTLSSSADFDSSPSKISHYSFFVGLNLLPVATISGSYLSQLFLEKKIQGENKEK